MSSTPSIRSSPSSAMPPAVGTAARAISFVIVGPSFSSVARTACSARSDASSSVSPSRFSARLTRARSISATTTPTAVHAAARISGGEPGVHDGREAKQRSGVGEHEGCEQRGQRRESRRDAAGHLPDLGLVALGGEPALVVDERGQVFPELLEQLGYGFLDVLLRGDFRVTAPPSRAPLSHRR